MLHIGEPIKYNHAFYEKEFLSRFQVVQNTCQDRQSFIQALQTQKYALLVSLSPLVVALKPELRLDHIDIAGSPPSFAHTFNQVVKWASGIQN